jgi:hypothetical protein
MKYKFSQQQIIGINYYYSKIAEGTFDEDDIRLLLIRLREFLRNEDNKDARSRQNAGRLMEIGDSIAHTIRDTLMRNGQIRPSIIHQRLAELVQTLASADGCADWNSIPFTLFSLDEIVEVFKNTLIDTGILYDAKNVSEVFRRESGDVRYA